MQGRPQQTAWHVVLPQPGSVVGVIQSVDVCEPSGNAAYGDELVAVYGQLAVGVRLDILNQIGSADSVFDNGREKVLELFCKVWDPEERFTLSTK